MKIRATRERISREADRMNLKLKLEPGALRALCQAGRTQGKEVFLSLFISLTFFYLLNSILLFCYCYCCCLLVAPF